MLVREIEHDATPDGAAHDDRLVELERVRDFQDHLHIVARGEAVFLVLPADRRRGLAVPGHVERDDAEALRDARLVEQAAVLAAVRPGRVQAEEWNARSGLFEIEPVRTAEQFEIEIAADDRFEARAHGATRRGAASTSLM